MSGSTFDKTLIDVGRRDVSLREYVVEDALADYIVKTYPKFITLLKEYYHFENEEYSPSRLIDELFNTRDITQTDIELLRLIEDEYLLGQSYFKGFNDKREAAKFSSNLYRSKGTKYSIQQFFRTFYGIDPDIIYTKENVFNVGEDKIGPDSQRYITDDKLYQTFAILIKSDIAINTWRENYKLFAHPAGMYLGAEVQIVGTAKLDAVQPPAQKADVPPYLIEGTAGLSLTAQAQHSALFSMAHDGVGSSEGNVYKFRTSLGNETTFPNQSGNDLNDVENYSIEQLDKQYSSLGELLTVNSPTFDDDDGTVTDGDIRSEFVQPISVNGMDFSSTETMDQDQWTWVENKYIDSDNSAFFNTLDSDGLGNKVAHQDSDSEINLFELI